MVSRLDCKEFRLPNSFLDSGELFFRFLANTNAQSDKLTYSLFNPAGTGYPG